MREGGSEGGREGVMRGVKVVSERVCEILC